jgi:hypothetical protein
MDTRNAIPATSAIRRSLEDRVPRGDDETLAALAVATAALGIDDGSN